MYPLVMEGKMLFGIGGEICKCYAFGGAKLQWASPHLAVLPS